MNSTFSFSWRKIQTSLIAAYILTFIVYPLTSAFPLHSRKHSSTSHSLWSNIHQTKRYDNNPFIKQTNRQSLSTFHPTLFSIHKMKPSRDDNLFPFTDSNNPFQKSILLIGKNTNILVSMTFFITLAYYRNAFMISFFIGACANGVLCKALKKIIRQERPVELQNVDVDIVKIKPKDNGMPSSHAMSLGFICFFTALTLSWTTVPLILFVMLSLIFRIQSKLHTKEQIGVGLFLGVINGYIWKELTDGTFVLLPSLNLESLITNSILPSDGILPLYQLWIPAMVGVSIVGSVERRISQWLSKIKQE